MDYGENCNVYYQATYLKPTAIQNIYSQTLRRETKVQRWEVTETHSSAAVTFCNKLHLSQFLMHISSSTEKVRPNEER